MKTNYIFLLLVFGAISCSIKNPAIVADRNFPIPTVIPSPTYDTFRCFNKERECEIAKSLGVSIQMIDSFSPDMQWVVIYDTELAKAPPDKNIGGMKFVKVDGLKEWEFNATQMREDIGECSNIFITNFWSNDSRYVYFSPDPSYCSRMINYSDVGTQVLYRLDIETGITKEYLPFVRYKFPSGHERFGLYTFEVSPDKRHLIYFQSYGSPMKIKIRDLETENEITYDLDHKYLEAGCPAWMDDSIHLLFYAATTTHPGDTTIATLFLVDLKEKTLKEIISDAPYIYCPISNSYYREDNPDPKHLIPIWVIDVLHHLRFLDQFYLNPLTEEKVLWATPTPYPSSTPKP